MRNDQKTPLLRAFTPVKLGSKYLLPYFLMSFFWLWLTPLFGQLDSLEQLLTQLPENKERVDILNQLSYGYHRKDVQQTFTYANQALALAQQLKYIKGIAYAKHYLSMGNGLSGDSKLAKQLNKRVIQLADSLQMFDLMINALNMQAFISIKNGKPVAGIKAYQRALDIAEREGDKIGYSSIALNIGEVNAQNKDFEKAKIYYHKALVAATEINEPVRIAWANRLIGNIYAEEKQYTKAVTFLKNAIKETILVKDNRSLAYAKSKLGEVYMALGKIELAEIEITASIQLIQTVGDKQGLIDSYIFLMNIHLKNNQYDKVINVGQKASEIIPQVNNVNQQLEIQAILAKAYAGEQNFQKAYQLNLLSQEIKDSLDFANKKNQATELEEKYQSKKKEAENALLRAEKKHQIHTIEQQKAINIFLAIVAILLGLLGYAAFDAYNSKRRNNLLLEEKVAERTQELQLSNIQLVQSNEELARFAYVTSHDLREPLQNITNFTTLLQKQLQNSQQEDAIQFMNIIQQNSIHMNKLIVDTLEFTRLSNIETTTTLVDLNQTLKNIKSAISSTLTKKKVTIELVKPLPIVQANDSLLLAVFKNLIENGITYNESPAPIIKIDHTIKGKNYLFSIADNGIGIPAEYQQTIFEMFKRLQNRDKYQGTGMGLSNCKKIIDQLGGKIWVESDGQNGATFFFTLPVSTITNLPKQEDKKVTNLAMSV